MENSIVEIIPDIVEKHWNYNLNIVDPNSVSIFSNEKFHWKNNSELDFFQTPLDIENKPTGSSADEKFLYYICKSIFPDTKSRFKVDGYEIDIYIPSFNVGIEYDGYFFHKNKLDKDMKKILYLKEKNIFLLRISNKDFDVNKKVELNYLTIKYLDNPQNVFDTIANFLIDFINKDNVIKFAKTIKKYDFKKLNMNGLAETIYVLGGDENRNSDERIVNFYKLHKAEILNEDIFKQFLILVYSRPSMNLFENIHDDALIEKFYNYPEKKYMIIDTVIYLNYTNNLEILRGQYKKIIDSFLYNCFEHILEESIKYLSTIPEKYFEKKRIDV